MDMILSDWIPITTQTGEQVTIAPWQITEGIGTDAEIVAFDAPRPDFNAALAQFLIGLLQTTFAPKDDVVWNRLYQNPPDPETLKTELAPWADAFELFGKGPRFMQDTDLDPETLEAVDIGALLIDTPGGNTEKLNQDHFVKRRRAQALSPAMATLALFTLQTNAPAGGVGYRTSLRGGGPLTTLLAPDPAENPDQNSLWHQLWLNVLPKKNFHDQEHGKPSDTLPWLAPTRHSNAKDGGRDTYPEDVHPLQAYWGMPRRILLDWDENDTGQCDLSGEQGPVIRRFYARNYGVNYNGPWRHPLSPHRKDKDGMPIPLHPQPGGFGYQHWLPWVLGDGEGSESALVVNQGRSRDLGPKSLRLWAFGYDMDNMKARCWYESTLPVLHLDEDSAAEMRSVIHDISSASKTVSDNLRQGLKNAWKSKGAKTKGDFSFVQSAFWHNTEPAFYDLLSQLRRCILDDRDDAPLRQQWFRTINDAALELFDTWATPSEIGDGNPERIAVARAKLENSNRRKSVKDALLLDQK